MAPAQTCIALVSGGIDSPVAVARMVRAGWSIIPVHCSQEPITGTEAEDKTVASLIHLIETIDSANKIDAHLRVVLVGETWQNSLNQNPSRLFCPHETIVQCYRQRHRR